VRDVATIGNVVPYLRSDAGGQQLEVGLPVHLRELRTDPRAPPVATGNSTSPFEQRSEFILRYYLRSSDSRQQTEICGCNSFHFLAYAIQHERPTCAPAEPATSAAAI
jgi:hypothetical protein